MGITVADNFKHLSKKFLDDRESFDTLADMKAASDASIPEGFETYCKATDKRYKFLSTNSVDPDTGKWREVEYGGGGTSDYTDLENKPQIEGITLTGNKTASDLGLAKANQIPTVPTKVSQLQNDSGFITDSALPGVYAGDTAGLVPAAGSDNEGKYLDNDGNWTVVPMPMIGTISRSDIYDTTEKVVGKWTDGRPLYQKTFAGTLNNANTVGTEVVTLVSVGASVSTYVEVEGFIINGTSNSMQAITTIKKGDYYLRMLAKPNNASNNANNIELYNAWFTSGTNTYVVTAKYTKTTDAANSYNYADENDYSTSEKIIGKWIDGKTLYQKTIACSGLPNNTTKSFAHSISNISSIIDVHGIAYAASNPSDFFPLPYVGEISGTNYQANVYANKTNVVIHTFTDWSIYNAYVTLKYTKA